MVDRWEYLTEYPYTIRHHVAGFFVAGYDTVVDVGVYKVSLPAAGNIHQIDPLGTVGGFRGTVADWWDSHNDLTGFALVVLGMAVEGDKREGIALRAMADAADIVVVEWASTYQNPVVSPEELTNGKNVVAVMHFDLPVVETPGFPVYPHRTMMVAK